MKDHTVKPGECMTSIAHQHGFYPDTLWEHAENKALRDKRKDPTRLMKDDVVKIPDPKPRTWFATTGSRHTYRLRSIPARFRMQFRHADGSPRAGEPWKLEFDGKKLEGKLDGEGVLEADLAPEVEAARLTVGKAEGEQSFDVMIGHLDPIEEISGVQARLQSLGYDCGGVSGSMDEKTEAALKAFQGSAGLEETGEADEATVKKLRELCDLLGELE